MTNLLTIGFYIVLAILVVVLVLGIANMARTDEKQASRSNKLMCLRVLVQGIAILMLVAIGFFAGAFS